MNSMNKAGAGLKRAPTSRQPALADVRSHPGRLRRLRHSEQMWAIVFLIPLAIGLGLVYFSAVYGLAMGFTDWNVIGTPRWAGLANYAAILQDQRFWTAMQNTLWLVLITVPLKMIIGLGLAMLLNHRVRGVSVFRLAFFFPFTCSVVAIALLWGYLYDPDGLLNTVLAFFGMNKVYWMSAQNALGSVSAVLVWEGMGYVALLFLAGLQNIPQEYYDAARVDGANRLQQVRHVTLPLLSPTTFFVLVIIFIGAFQTFGEVYVLKGPQDSTLTIVQYIYENAFSDFDMGYAAALSYILIVIIFIVTVIQLRLQKRWVHYDL